MASAALASRDLDNAGRRDDRVPRAWLEQYGLSYDSPNSASAADSILGWPFRAVNNYDFHWSLDRIKLQPDLLLDRSEERGPSRIRAC